MSITIKSTEFEVSTTSGVYEATISMHINANDHLADDAKVLEAYIDGGDWAPETLTIEKHGEEDVVYDLKEVVEGDHDSGKPTLLKYV